jgi:Fur family ferric uptake transcriptional regulator/Fur family peroxide stress response transcriptional regulator
MENPITVITNRLTVHGIKPSVQRIAIMRYLMEHPTHPTAEEIHSALVEEMPMLSRTTVYNTLWLMAKHSAISVIAIDRNNARFDYDCTPHAHFLCNKCGAIYDLKIEKPNVDNVPQGFKVEYTHIYHTGICPSCLHADKLKGKALN